ncbi:MAG: MBL fold metallo-hydrolase [Actinomycetota bacterium]|nr:MBL fold metallo-hydrolase [Actinomycetota bacterium]
MELTVLGSSAAWPDAGLAASGYLLREDGFNAVLDLGTGVLSNLQLHIPHQQLGAVIITHSHIDHCIDLHPLFMARLFHPEPLPPLPLFAPPGVFERVAGLEDAEGVAEMRKLFDVHEVEPGAGFEAGPLRVSTRLLPHWVPNAGLRIQADGRVLVYTGDTGPSEEIEALARDADAAVIEASWRPEQAEGRPPFHLTARQAAEHAARAGAGRLVLSHFWPGADRDASRDEAAAVFDGEITVAHEGMRLEVGG